MTDATKHTEVLDTGTEQTEMIGKRIYPFDGTTVADNLQGCMKR